MKYLTILGEKKYVPGYPHHKNYVYRCQIFFDCRTYLSNVLINGIGKALRQAWMKRKYGIAIPFNLLIDPTSACNLKCTGCWAADYDKGSNLSFEKLDEIIEEAEKLGISDIVMSGGEPLMRKKDILRLSEKYKRLPFALFTNGTLIDETFADEMARLGNLNVFISLEGFKEQTDQRRGDGVYDKVIKAMELLHERDIGFGYSVTYHAFNYQEVCSDEFLDFMRQKGAWLGWFFNYMPIGCDSDTSYCCNASQRNYVREKLESYKKRTGFIIVDFANLGHKAIGCVAAGVGFTHINAHGDVEPCAFNHYSDVNIHDTPLRKALASPFFKRFQKMMPFSENLSRPCPIMDVPEAIVELTKTEGVHSTHLYRPETAEQLAMKTRAIAEEWKPVADEIYTKVPEKEKRKSRLLLRFLRPN